jgi:hypothetical protein
MATNIRCYTLFDITKTNITSRRNPVQPSSSEIDDWLHKRNTQCNFDTILQVISLRAQPENITDPVRKNFSEELLENFGFLFANLEPKHYWSFSFTVNYPSVFLQGSDEFGALYNDCENVPMIKIANSINQLSAFLDCSPELKNIHFEVVNDD